MLTVLKKSLFGVQLLIIWIIILPIILQSARYALQWVWSYYCQLCASPLRPPSPPHKKTKMICILHTRYGMCSVKVYHPPDLLSSPDRCSTTSLVRPLQWANRPHRRATSNYRTTLPPAPRHHHHHSQLASTSPQSAYHNGTSIHRAPNLQLRVDRPVTPHRSRRHPLGVHLFP